jgi:alpha-L-fucosidase
VNRRTFLLAAAAAARASSADAPAPYGAIPSPRQLKWHAREIYAFLHFTTNTFTDKEWGYGDENEAIFNPTAFDAAAMVSALKAGGMTGVILTCKHHDGFCLWPTKTTEHSVRRSPWRDGKGDVVKEISEAARAQGLAFGVYLSPWDRNTAKYGTPAYVAMYRAQLRELLTNYGPIFEVWHDGANGGDGFYGGAREKRTIDKLTYYDWPKTWELVRTLQPNACIFSDVGPDIRWVGNESGFANETSWATYDPVGEKGDAAAPGYTRSKEGGTGHRDGKRWLPAECDVSIRPGWFWHEKENDRVKTPAQLMDLYYKSTGRGGSFLLNVPPDRRGLLHENDIASLKGFGDKLRATFTRNLATGAKLTASATRPGFPVQNLFDSDRVSYWSVPDDDTTPNVILDFPRPVRFNIVRLRENISLGQRIDSVALETWRDNDWKLLGEATSIGNCRLIRLGETHAATRLRLRIVKAAACPALSDLGLFLEG